MVDKIGMSVKDMEADGANREWERASYAIFDALEKRYEVNLLEQPAMGHTVDLDAIDRFFAGYGDRSLSFEYESVCVTVIRKNGKQRIVFD